MFFFFSSRRRHTRCALVTGVQTCALPISWSAYINRNQLSWSDPEFTLSKELYAPMEFESYVVNSGGNIQNFRLNNLPPWLDASPMSGTVDPLGRQKITFTVHQGLNIGSYDEEIGRAHV